MISAIVKNDRKILNNLIKNKGTQMANNFDLEQHEGEKMTLSILFKTYEYIYGFNLVVSASNFGFSDTLEYVNRFGYMGQLLDIASTIFLD